MKIRNRCVNAVFWALLVPGCSSLSSNQKPRTPLHESSTLPWGQKAKQWAAAGLLGASLVLGTNAAPATALTSAPTKIEVNVETDYLVRALDYFDGDVKKTLGAVVRAPGSSVRIDPPEEARDELLRALYPFKEPEEYATQAAWVGVTVKPEKTWIDSMTEKQYKIIAGEEAELSVALSNLDIGVAAIVVSFPLTFGAGQAEKEKEEKIAAGKKAAVKAKKAAIEQKNAAAMRAKMRAQGVTAGEIPKGPKGVVKRTHAVTDFIPEVTEPAVNGAATTESSQVAPGMEQAPVNPQDSDKSFSISLDPAALSQMAPGTSNLSVKGRLSTEPGDSEGFTISIDESALLEGLAQGASTVVLRGRLEAKQIPSSED
jgi:hypothetical protein